MLEKFIVEGDELPQWMRTSFVDANGEIYLACGAVGNEMSVSLCMAHDGVTMVRDGGHAYAPVTWLAREYPRHADEVRKIAEIVRTWATRAPAVVS